MSTPTLAELLEMSRDSANRTRTNKAPSPCVDCPRSLTILPLRYCVVSGTDPALLAKLAPALPAHLGRQLTPRLSHSRYAVRSVREGYIYLLLKRTGKDYVCESVHRVHDSGALQPVWPNDPGIPIGHLLGNWTLKVGDPQDVDEARLLFTPDPLSPAMLKRYQHNSRYRNRLQKFDLRTLASSCGQFDDVVVLANVESTVAEFLAAADPAAKALLEQQAFPPFRSSLQPGETPRAMGSIYQSALDSLMGGGGVALVLEDPIGIVQELNAWRNDAIEMSQPWLHAVDAQGISNERKYIVAEALDDVKATMRAGYVEKQVDQAAVQLEAAKYRNMRNMARFGIGFEDLEEQKRRHDPERVRTQAEADKETVFKPYEDRLDWAAKEQIQTDFKRHGLQAQQEMDARQADHLAWLCSTRVEQALDTYDRDDAVWGQAFATQVAQCILGMNGCGSGAAQLASWWADTEITSQNLVWRAMTRNQTEIEKQTRIAFAKAQSEQVLSADNIVAVLDSASTWFEKVADLLAKADAVEASAMASSHRWFDPRRLMLVLPLLATLQQYLMSLIPGNAVDRHLMAPLLGFIHAGLGRATVNLRMSDLAAVGHTANRNRVTGQVNAHIARVRDTLLTEFQHGGDSKFYQIRGGTLLALIEGVILGIKYSNKENGDKERLEYRAAFLITSAAGIELAATGVQSVANRYAPTGVVGRGAAVSLGGLRLFGGSLATVGGAMLSFIDFEEGIKYVNQRHTMLSAAYFARSVVSIGVAHLSSVVSVSYSAPLLRALFSAHSNSTVIISIENLAASRAPAIILRLIGIGTIITIGLSIAILYYSPSKLEEWCWHSSLKKWKAKETLKPFKDTNTELEKLYQAFQAAN